MTALLVSGGPILTQDPRAPVAEALLVDGERIAAVGDAPAVAAQAPAGSERLDLDGGVVCPGFIDAHNHFCFAMLAELGVDCRVGALGSVEQLLDELARVARAVAPGAWIRGWGYSELDLGRHPRLDELDAISPENPLLILHMSGHMCVANSRALAAAGITAAGGDPPNGRVRRERLGNRPTGVLEEQASEAVDVLARNAIIAADPAACVRAGHAVARRYAAHGLTTVCDPCVPVTVEPLYDELLRDPEFPLRLVGLGIGAAGMFAPPADRVDGDLADGFAISGIKFFADGGEQCSVCTGVHGAARIALHTLVNAARHRTLLGARVLTAPVARIGWDGRLHAGMKFHTHDDLAGLLERTADRGLVGAVHAMGNEAIDQVIGVGERVRRRCGDDAVLRMEHAMMPDEQSFARMAALGMAAVVQPRFVHDFGFPLLLTGTDRRFRVLAFRDLMDHGVLLAGSSDAPVADPAVLPAIESAVTRATAHGDVLDRSQCLSVEEALVLYTTNAARVLGLERSVGTLRPGLRADFVVLDDDPRGVDPATIGAIGVSRTYRAGRRVS